MLLKAYSGNTTLITFDRYSVLPERKILFKESAMHNLLVALAFVAMVACPVFVAAMPQHQTEDEA
jgi:hypothetical protein